jgi:hypothetical protein
MLRWWRQRRDAHQQAEREARVLVEADADALIKRFGEVEAFVEAHYRREDVGGIVDGNRPHGHWKRVKDEIRRRRGF